MQITIMGLFTIPLGLILFIFKYEWLIYTTLFFSGFTGSSIINIGDISIQPSYYLFILFFIRYLFNIVKTGKLVKPNLLLSVFIIISFISLIMPVILDGKNIVVLNPDNKYEPVKFKFQNVTQYMYILIAFFSYCITKDYLIRKKYEECEKFIKIFLYSSLTVSLIGLYQLVAHKFNLPFDEIFRSGVHGNIQTIKGVLRIYSVFIEPSMYSIFLIFSIILCIYIPKKIFKYKNILLILLLLNGILSTSSTFFIGFILIVIFIIFEVIKTKYSEQDIKFNKYIVIILMLVAISIILVLYFEKDIINNLLDGITAKLEGEGASSTSRRFAFETNFNVALQYPILGVGFGSVRSYDLISTWLSSIGFFGTACIIFYIISKVIKSYKINSYIYRGYSIGMLIIFILMFISVPEPYGLFIWMNIGILEIILLNLTK